MNFSQKILVNNIELHGFCHIITRISPKKTHITPSLRGWYGWWYGKKHVIVYLLHTWWSLLRLTFYLLNCDCYSLSSPVSSLNISVSHGENWTVSGNILMEYVIIPHILTLVVLLHIITLVLQNFRPSLYLLPFPR